ncbi:hypothetical protein SO802_012563 [Lithocarpus litseifolius]|uniref:RNase H type-1 domain-containing protein n=1 Tax=Lithocarpus litseifolius TaxID=425828 RepID=A0AAW2D342_9ROSI
MKTNLVKRKVLMDDLCDHCHHDPEDVLDALWQCPHLDHVWNSNPCWNFRAATQFSSFVDLKIKWKPPDPTCLKVNFDGAVFREDNMAGVGVIIRDKMGQIIASMAEGPTSKFCCYSGSIGSGQDSQFCCRFRQLICRGGGKFKDHG